MIDLDDIRQDIFDIKTVPKVFYVYRGDTFELDLSLTISSTELNSVVLNCDGLPEATGLTVLETTDVSSKWHLVLNKSQTLILTPKTYDFTITIVRTDGTELTLYKGIIAVNNRVHSNYSNNYYIAALLKQTVPTVSDNDYLIGTMWVNVLTDRVYFLTSVVNNEAKWIEYSITVDRLNIRIDDILDGTTIVKKAEQDQSGNVIHTTYETKNDATNKLETKVDKTTRVIGLDLQDDILLTEFKTALGNATQSVAGLLSAEDKTHLDGLVALLESSDGNTVVDTIGEILAIFNNYPEGADLVTALNGKVDKVAGKDLSQNDFTDALKNKLDGLLNGSQYYDKNYIDALKDQLVEIIVEEWNTNAKTLALSDSNKLFKCSHTTDQTLTIPTNATVAFPIGTMITFLLTSTYTVTFVGASGVTLTSIDSLSSLTKQFATAKLIKVDTDTWHLEGTLANSPVANYVSFVSAASRTITPKYTNSGITLEYSVDYGETWTTIASGSETTSATEHRFRGQATGTKSLFTLSDVTNAWAFSGSSDLEVYGNLNFLLCDTLGDKVAPTSLGDYAYARMFYGCTSLTTAPQLPATTLANVCYASMFHGCTSLVTAPELPVTTLATSCYVSMFQGCTSLATAPELPAATLKNYCYNGMFYGCASLTTAPELPATTLASSCYEYMFRGCISLTTAPELPATTLVSSCCGSMFYGCTSFKVSATQTGSYIYPWRIPTSETGTAASGWWNLDMLKNTGGTFKSDPAINTTYYVENQPV